VLFKFPEKKPKPCDTHVLTKTVTYARSSMKFICKKKIFRYNKVNIYWN